MALDIPSFILPNWPDIGEENKTYEDQWWGSLPKEVLRQDTGGSTASNQWLRRMELLVYGATQTSSVGDSGAQMTGEGRDAAAGKGSGLRLSGMRVNFQVKKQTSTTPNMLYARVYNLAPGTMTKIKQFTRVSLSAGYWGTSGDPAIFSKAGSTQGGGNGNYGLIFDGTVVMYIVGKENAVDTYLDIWAGDGDQDIYSGLVNLTFPSGTKIADKADKIAKDGFKVEIGKIEIPDDRKSVRSETMIGPAAHLLRDISNQTNTHYWLEEGKVYLIPFSGYAFDQEVTLAPTTGLVGMPKVTPGGIQAQCLLNPKLRLGGRVKIDTGVLSDVPYLPGGDLFSTGKGMWNVAAIGKSKRFDAAATSPTGQYKILFLEHHGDNRGQNWYSNIICSDATGGSPEPTAFQRSAVAGLGAAKPTP